ncbi:aldo/keto reductase [Brenneria goodwinii]|uniref:aldo/keto reductase n=1 Tax=Brenneria goodwinii TaxID=1109412 RepID=UPI000EF19FCA|nr:aldo/keto reductase [Brenneria goodwinii]MCG8155341.1 aldo/keto reductase [Brenneria goodwinii]MCG8159585.1 aldo/keto reductase [Brenneria goodwinii]MCG8164246.1 aldo/keto reductase [Brenneria goodwinii]MCG8169188.1 aldo/keto reductase [Brenneria goodwinii]MCG8173444.1 aldo/keto reductase [Brenneria goodwinii]
MAIKEVSFPDGTKVPAIGQGTWFMGEKAQAKAQEVKALQTGIEQGLTLIDTAEMYADGGAELVVGEAIRARRDKVYLVSKVYPHNAGGAKAIKACEQSLKRLQTDYIDLYLLHWRGNIPLTDTIAAMQQLQRSGKIGRWGVSNLDIDDMQELWSIDGGQECMTDQVLYHLASRGIEFDLLPWCQQQHVPVMAYCPIAQAGRLRNGLFAHPVINAIAGAHAITPAQVLLAWVIRQTGVIAIPKASSELHVKENAQVLDIVLHPDELALLDQAFPPPKSKQHLDVV